MPEILSISVVIPCYKVKNHILSVLSRIGPLVTSIYIVDDCCPQKTGEFVSLHCDDPRIKVLQTPKNLGVGGAVKLGYRYALENGADIILKLDGDNQMDPALIPNFIKPILSDGADYTKGNRFHNPTRLLKMPITRLIGNSVLSLISKFSSGYWHIFDPTNGYTAIHKDALIQIPLEKIDSRFFFESDMLFRLNLNGSRVKDVPMEPLYSNEESNLNILTAIPIFTYKHAINFIKRIIYSYYLRDMSIASIELPLGMVLILFGVIYGGIEWYGNLHSSTPASPGVVMLAGLTVLIGIQLLLAFISYDISQSKVNSL
jgi:dolichol-phosphate mannosyltransferase